ncbi:hypothetical protein ACFW93_45550 [Streptomyces canus]|uniref:hypothetical protein n=1 Tax=Streptomyces canus TaxID=58343 RepID=UPI0036968E87
MLLFALGGIGLNYIALLIVAKLAGDIADGAELTVGSALPYVMDALVDLPPMVIADLLGIHPKTAERWATLAGGNWSEYLAARRAAPQSWTPSQLEARESG